MPSKKDILFRLGELESKVKELRADIEDHYKPITLQDKIIQWANKWGYKGVAPECIEELRLILKDEKEVKP